MAEQEALAQMVGQTIETIVSKAPYAAAGLTLVGGFTLNEWLQICGIISIPITLYVNWYMQRERNRILRDSVNSGLDVNQQDKGIL